MTSVKEQHLLERGYCPSPFWHGPAPVCFGVDGRARCPVCLRWIKILANGNYAMHKRRPLTEEEYAEAFACSVCPARPARGYYMVTDEVWAAAQLGPKQMACLHCLAERLGRPLRAADFTPAPINKDFVTALEANEVVGRAKPKERIDHDSSTNNCGCSSCIELDYRRG
jgi:hypothetical protein